VGAGIVGLVFVSFRFVEAFGGGGADGAGPAGISAVVDVLLPQPATAIAAAASRAESW
jgi:hypothetical protein